MHPDVYNHLFQFGEKVSIKQDNIPGFGSWKYQSDDVRSKIKINSYKYLETLDDIRKTNMHNFLQNVPELNEWFLGFKNAR